MYEPNQDLIAYFASRLDNDAIRQCLAWTKLDAPPGMPCLALYRGTIDDLTLTAFIDPDLPGYRVSLERTCVASRTDPATGREMPVPESNILIQNAPVKCRNPHGLSVFDEGMRFAVAAAMAWAKQESDKALARYQEIADALFGVMDAYRALALERHGQESIEGLNVSTEARRIAMSLGAADIKTLANLDKADIEDTNPDRPFAANELVTALHSLGISFQDERRTAPSLSDTNLATLGAIIRNTDKCSLA